VETRAGRTGPEPGIRALWARTAAVFGLAALLGGFFVRVGSDTIPILRAAHEVAPATGFHVADHLGPGHPDADFYRLVSRSPFTVLRLAESAPGIPLHVTDVALFEYNAVFLPRASTLLRAGPVQGQARSQRDYEIDLVAPRIYQPGEPIWLTEEWAFARFHVPLLEAGDPPPGVPTVCGVVEAGSLSLDAGIEVLFFRNNLLVRPPGLSPDALLARVEGPWELELAVPGDTVRVSFDSGIVSNDLPGEEGAAHRSTYSQGIDQKGKWSIGAVLRLPSDSAHGPPPVGSSIPQAGRGTPVAVPAGLRDCDPGTAEDPPSLEGRMMPMIVGLRLTSLAGEYAEGDLAQARLHAEAGNVQEARRHFGEALKWAEETENGELNNGICWEGTLRGFADTVQAACERALELEPNQGSFLDSRAVNRGARGDREGAAEDLRSLLDWAEGQPSPPSWVERRRDWLDALERGESPFDEEMLRSLALEELQRQLEVETPSFSLGGKG
jgi:hypothetical protein